MKWITHLYCVLYTIMFSNPFIVHFLARSTAPEYDYECMNKKNICFLGYM